LIACENLRKVLRLPISRAIERDKLLGGRQTIVSTDSTGAVNAHGKHVVHELIEERASHLMASPFWPLYRSILYPLLRHKAAIRMANTIRPLPARGVFDYLSALLHIDLDVVGAENIPAKGRVIIAASHPTGIPDGIAMFDAIKHRRADMTYFANRDALRAAPNLGEAIIPVEWVSEKRTPLRSRETLAAAIKAFNDEKCVVLFASGRIAFMDAQKNQIEQPWAPSVAIFARKYNCPVVPAHIEARNSWLYYWFWKLNPELRDITLFNELLNKRGKPYKITFGAVIDPADLKGDPSEVAKALREHTINIASGRRWRPVEQDA